MSKYKFQPQLQLLVGSWHLLKQVMGFGNPSAGGALTMNAALASVAEMNKDLMRLYGLEFAVSGHQWHEIVVPSTEEEIGYSAQWNNPRAIELPEWMAGVKTGIFPPIGRIIPPGFGIDGADDGAFIHPDKERRKLMHDIMVYSFRKSREVKVSSPRNQGDVIYWTGPDGLRWQRIVRGDDVLLGYDLNPELEEWKLITHGVGSAVKDALGLGYIVPGVDSLLAEFKAAGDPCYLDPFTDPHLEVRGIDEMNEIAGSKVVRWQGELCHERGAGWKFHKAMKVADQGEVFDGEIHFNAGGLAAVNFSKLLAKPGGTKMSLFPQYVDNDYLPGEGPEEWLDDQKESIAYGVRWSARTGKPFKVEFDARFCRYHDMIERLWKSAVWTIEVFERYAEALMN